jgi:hypothetical protein
MLRMLLSSFGALIAVAATPAYAQDTLHWRNVGQWQIRIDRTLDYGCFMFASYTRGTVIRVGIDQQNRNGYVLVGNDAWRSLQVGNRYELALQFDGDAPWRGRATARTIGSGRMVFLHLPFERAQFLVDFARRQTLTILYNGRVVTQLPLIGTRAATQELFRCQRAADIARENSRPPRDPFSSGGGRDGPGGGGRRPDQASPPPQAPTAPTSPTGPKREI